jgi:hypothetical protein
VARKTESKEIDGVTYALTSLGALKAQRVFHRIMSAVGPSLAALGGSAPPGESLLDGKTDIGGAVRLLFDRLTITELEAIEKDLLETLTMVRDGKIVKLFEGPHPAVDNEMAGNVTTIFKLVVWAAEVNFQDVFSGFKKASLGLGDELLARVLGTQRSNSQKTSDETGPSSASSSPSEPL